MRFFLCLVFLLSPSLLIAQTPTFSRVAREVEMDLKKAQAEETLTLADVAEKRKGLMTRRDRLRADIKRESEAFTADELRLSEMRKKRLELTHLLQTHTGRMKELDAVIRDFARNFYGLAERSAYSAETPDRLTVLKNFLDKNKILGIRDIQTLVALAFKDMTASGQIIRREGGMVDRRGETAQGEIIRMGNLTAIYRRGGDVGYLRRWCIMTKNDRPGLQGQWNRHWPCQRVNSRI